MPMTFTFAEMVSRLGEITACAYLTEIERAAGIKPQYDNADLEARLANAISLQDAQLAA